MKKILAILLILVSTSLNVNAQWFVAGGTNIGYLKNNFQFALKPSAGYEFNDRWAVGLGLGMEVISDNVYGYVEPYARFNCWNNDKVFLDVKARAELLFNRDLIGSQIGLSPSIRIKLNDHWQVYGDVGLFGVEYYDGEWGPAFGVGSVGIATGVIYRF